MITVSRADLETVMGAQATWDDLIKAGKAKLEGDRRGFDRLRAAMVAFTPDLEILPGTKPKAPTTPSKQNRSTYTNPTISQTSDLRPVLP